MKQNIFDRRKNAFCSRGGQKNDDEGTAKPPRRPKMDPTLFSPAPSPEKIVWKYITPAPMPNKNTPHTTTWTCVGYPFYITCIYKQSLKSNTRYPQYFFGDFRWQLNSRRSCSSNHITHICFVVDLFCFFPPPDKNEQRWFQNERPKSDNMGVDTDVQNQFFRDRKRDASYLQFLPTLIAQPHIYIYICTYIYIYIYRDNP